MVLLQDAEVAFLVDCLEAFEREQQQPSKTFEPPMDADQLIPKAIFWHPLLKEALFCPIHHGPLCDTQRWSVQRKGKSSPRLIYSLGLNSVLVSKGYRCDECGPSSLWFAHNPGIISQLTTSPFCPNFLVSQKWSD